MMKNKINILLFALFITKINSEVMAQKSKNIIELKTISTSETIHVSSDSLWNIIRQPNISKWSTLLDSTEYFGEKKFENISWSKRRSIVNSKKHHESHEDLIYYNDMDLEIKFASTKFPNFIISNQTHWKVIEQGLNQSKLKTTTVMQIKKNHAFFLKKYMLKAINKNAKGLNYDIKHYAENGVVSPSKQDRMIELHKEQLEKETNKKVILKKMTSDTIHVSADSLWAICREFDKTAEWTSTLSHSYGTGEPVHEGATCSSRTCEVNFRKEKKIHEELVMFSDINKELSYNLTEGAPGFITYANNHWKVSKIGDKQSKIEMNITIHMKKFPSYFLGNIISSQMKKQVRIVLDELKIYAETGEVSKAKKKQLSKNKKN